MLYFLGESLLCVLLSYRTVTANLFLYSVLDDRVRVSNLGFILIIH